MSGTIVARDLGKRYKRYRGHWPRLAEWLTGGRLVRHEDLWALRQVSFRVDAGEAVGIVGQNGAGKSTLLKLVVGTTQATEGSFQVEGRVAALLELGMGFHPDFNGLQNATMALQMMGWSEDDARQELPGIRAFSELGDFLEQPIRTYSSGMQMRLGFAVATARRPAILIVDEALAVGDAYFQHKCIRRIRDFKDRGTTMLFVSHDPAAVKTLCDRALLLDQGRLIREGSAESILDYYNAIVAKREKDASVRQIAINEGRVKTRSGDGKVKILSVAMTDTDDTEALSFATGDAARIRCRFRFEESLTEYTVGFLVRDRLGNDVFGANTLYLGVDSPAGIAGQELETVFDVTLNLGYGHYSLTVAVHSPTGHMDQNHDWIDNVLSFQVIPGDGYRFAGVAGLPVRASFSSPRG